MAKLGVIEFRVPVEPRGTPLTDSCDLGAYEVRTIVDDIGSGKLRRRDKPLSGRRR